MTYLDTVLVLNIIISLHHNKLDVFWLQTTKSMWLSYSRMTYTPVAK